jgi:hypothetical protein
MTRSVIGGESRAGLMCGDFDAELAVIERYVGVMLAQKQL